MKKNLLGMNILGVVLLIALTVLSPWVSYAQKKQEKAPAKGSGLILSAEDTKRLLNAYNLKEQAQAQIDMAQAKLAAAQANKDKLEAQYDAYNQYLGRVYGFDPEGTSYSFNDDGTSEIHLKEEKKK